MGVNNITDAPGDGNPITNEFLQGPVSALEGDIVPRSPTGVPTAQAGSLGTEIYPFSAVYADKLVVGNQEISTGGGGGTPPGGPGSITPGSTIQNGVVNGLEPAGRPGMCGWLHQAGSSGVVVSATTGDPLVVKLDGTTYERASNITGGTLPSNYTATISPPLDSSGRSATYGGTSAGQTIPMNADRALYRYSTGGVFDFHSATASEVLPDEYGNNVIIKSTGGATGTTYTYCQRISNAATASGSRNRAKLKMGGVFNTSPTAQVYPGWQLPWHTTHQVIRCGALFVDPLTATWNLTISPRIVGAVNTDLPGTTGYNTGDVVFLERGQRWHRFSGTAWVRTSFVFLGFLAIDSGAVVGVLPVRTEASLGAMFDKKFAVLGDAVSREGVVDGDSIRFGGENASVEDKGFAELGGQQFNQIGTSAVIDTSDAEAGTLSNGEMFCVYLDVEADRYYFSAEPPVYQIYRQRLLLVHPNRQRLFVGSFCTNSSGGLVARQSISSRFTRLNEGNDDSYRLNPCLFGRSAMVDRGQPEGRRMQIDIRGDGNRSSGTNNLRYRWAGTSRWGYQRLLENKDDWDQLLFSWLTPHVLEEIRYDTDNSNDLIVAFSQWDEPSLLYATGLTEAAREGRAQGAGASGAGGALASVDAPQLAGGSVGQDALGLSSVGLSNIDAIDAPAAGDLLKVAVDPDDATRLLLEWGTSGGVASIPDNSITYPKFNTGVLGDEEDVLAPDDTDLKIVNNRVLHDILEDIRSESAISWGAWSAEASVNPGSIQDGESFTTGDQSILYRSSSVFNAKTTAIAAGGLVLATKDVSGMPALTSGTIRGGLIFDDEYGSRWIFVIDNPESPDSEEFFQLDSTQNWVAVGYRGNELGTSYNGVKDIQRWAPMSALAKNKPTANAFSGNAIVVRHNNTQEAVYAAYSTITDAFSVFYTEREFVVLADSAVAPANIATSNTGTNNQYLQLQVTGTGSDAVYSLRWNSVSGGSGLTIGGTKATGKVIRATGTGTNDQEWSNTGMTTEEIYSSTENSGAGKGLGEFTLSTGKLATNYDALVLEACVSGDSSVCYLSGMYVRSLLTISSSGTEMTVGRHDVNQEINVRMETATTGEVTHADTLRLRKIHGVNFR